MKNSTLLLLLGAIIGGNLTAQVSGTGGMGGTTPTTGNGGQTSVQANPSLGSGGGIRGADISRPIFISGKVAMQDGSPLLQNVAIQSVCSGISRDRGVHRFQRALQFSMG